MGAEQLSGRTFVPTIGEVRWIASVHDATGTAEVTHLLTYGPSGHLAPAEQQLFLEYETRLPGGRKRTQPTVRFV